MHKEDFMMQFLLRLEEAMVKEVGMKMKQATLARTEAE